MNAFLIRIGCRVSTDPIDLTSTAVGNILVPIIDDNISMLRRMPWKKKPGHT